MKIGYARVSTNEQNLDRQIIELKEYQAEEIFTDKASGKDSNRQGFKRMLKYARKGDTVVVSSLDRLGRNYDDVKQTLDLLNKNNIKIEIIDAPFLNFNTGNVSLDKALFDMLTSLLSYIADNERKKMLERQAQGIKVAKAKGIYKGKPKEYSETAKDKKKRAIYHSIVNDLANDLPIKRIAEKYSVTRKLVYRIKNELSEENLNAWNF